jgi:glycosyltransferase involved in cell wall biosynthesis
MNTSKVLVICHLTNSKSNGQVSKTNDIISFLEKHNYDVDILNYGKFNFFEKVFSSKSIVKKYDKIILMPGGKRALFYYINLLTKLNKTNTHYVAIGGWVLNLLNDPKNKKYFEKLKFFKGVYLQNIKTVEAFKKNGFNNVFNVSSFSSKIPISDEQANQKYLNYTKQNKFNFCFFARVEKTKGVLLACDAVKRAIEKYPNKDITFDIYGEIKDEELRVKLSEIVGKNPQISYKGVLSSSNCLAILSSYFCMLFPTFYKGEGTPHTIIESFMAGLPIIVSDWAYNSELVENKKTGLIFDLNTDDLFEKICWTIENSSELSNISRNCYAESKKFDVEKLFKPLLDNLKD